MAAISTTLWTCVRATCSCTASRSTAAPSSWCTTSCRSSASGPRGLAPAAPAVARGGDPAARQHGRVAVIYVETPANPTNGLVDIGRCAALADQLKGEQDHRPPVIVDNTFLGPLWQQPLALGADLVIYSLTKYVGGHSDVIAGASLGLEALISGVRGMRTILGTMSDPHTGWLLMRSLETLKLRMTGAMKNARYVAEFLADHPKVKQVHYPDFLPDDHPDAAIYRRQCKAPGSTFSFEVHGGGGSPAAQPSAAGPPRGEPRRHREPGRAPGHHDAFGHSAGAPGRARHHAGDDPPVGRRRAPRGSDRRPRAGARGGRGDRARNAARKRRECRESQANGCW